MYLHGWQCSEIKLYVPHRRLTLEMQPEIVGSNGVHDDASCDENEADDSIKHIRILAETLVDVLNR